jgi:hypothetical protein
MLKLITLITGDVPEPGKPVSGFTPNQQSFHTSNPAREIERTGADSYLVKTDYGSFAARLFNKREGYAPRRGEE